MKENSSAKKLQKKFFVIVLLFNVVLAVAVLFSAYYYSNNALTNIIIKKADSLYLNIKKNIDYKLLNKAEFSTESFKILNEQVLKKINKLKENRENTHIFISTIDKNGDLIYILNTKFKNNLNKTILKQVLKNDILNSVVETIKTDKKFYDKNLYNYLNNQKYYVYYPIGDSYKKSALAVGIDISTFIKEYRTFLSIFSLITLALFILSSFLMVYVLKKVVTPFLQKVEYHDYLTDLKNKNSYETYLSKIKELANDEKKYLFVIVFNLNDLNKINEKHGKKEGDKYLVHFSDILKRHLSSRCEVFRVGGDEFVAIGTFYSKQVLQEYLSAMLSAKNNISISSISEMPLEFAFGCAQWGEQSNIHLTINEAYKNMHIMKYNMK